MAKSDYTDSLYHELLKFESAFSCFKAYVDLLPQNEDDPHAPMEIIRNHSELLSFHLEELFESFSSLRVGLRLVNQQSSFVSDVGGSENV